MRNEKYVRWNTLQITALGFLGVILLGSALLYLPVSNTRPNRLFGRAVYFRHFGMRDRTRNRHARLSVYHIWKNHPASADSDRRLRRDCLHNRIFLITP